MSVGAIGAYSPVQIQTNQYNRAAASQDSSQQIGGPPDGGALIDAIASALKEIGASAATEDGSSDGASSEKDAAQALGDFLHSLSEALHAQGGAGRGGPGGPGGAGGAGGPGGTAGAGGPPPPPPKGGGPGGGQGGGIATDLKSLIQSLATTGENDDSSSALQTSFSQLVSSLGLDSSTKLSDFLQAFSNNLQGASTSGSLINTTA